MNKGFWFPFNKHVNNVLKSNTKFQHILKNSARMRIIMYFF